MALLFLVNFILNIKMLTASCLHTAPMPHRCCYLTTGWPPATAFLLYCIHYRPIIFDLFSTLPKFLSLSFNNRTNYCLLSYTFTTYLSYTYAKIYMTLERCLFRYPLALALARQNSKTGYVIIYLLLIKTNFIRYLQIIYIILSCYYTVFKSFFNNV